MRVKEESEKAGIKLNIQKIKIVASGPITSWQIDTRIKPDNVKEDLYRRVLGFHPLYPATLALALSAHASRYFRGTPQRGLGLRLLPSFKSLSSHHFKTFKIQMEHRDSNNEKKLTVIT